MSITKFAKIPPARLQWDGFGFYDTGYPYDQEYLVELKRRNKDTISINEFVLSPSEAYELYQDLVSATLAVVIQHGNRKHPVQVETVVQIAIPYAVSPGETVIPNHFVQEIIAWLRAVLGITPYTGDAKIWEY